jgi:hypothetical protein
MSSLIGIAILSVAVLVSIVLFIEYKTNTIMGIKSFAAIIIISISVWLIDMNTFFKAVTCWSALVLAVIILYRAMHNIKIDDDCMTNDYYNDNDIFW